MSNKMLEVFEGILDDKEYLESNSTTDGVYNYAAHGMNIILSHDGVEFLVRKLAEHANLDRLGLLDSNTYWHEFENPILETT